MRLLDIAKKYLAAGFAPIPVKPNSKIPLIKWEEYNRRKPAIAEIEEWFKDESLNMAIITGELYGITVIDDDTLNGFEGISSPLRVKTPNGMHHYFKYSEKLSRNSVNSQKMVDVRSTGGIVLVPPSTINSKKYQWIGGLKELQNLPSVPDELTQEIKT